MTRPRRRRRLRLPLRLWIPVVAIACAALTGGIMAKDALDGMEEALLERQEVRLADLAALQAHTIEERLALVRRVLADHVAAPEARAHHRDLRTTAALADALGPPVSAAMRAGAEAAVARSHVALARHIGARSVTLDLKAGPWGAAAPRGRDGSALRWLWDERGGSVRVSVEARTAPSGAVAGARLEAVMGREVLTTSRALHDVRMRVFPPGAVPTTVGVMRATQPLRIGGLPLVVLAEASRAGAAAPVGAVRADMIRDATWLLVPMIVLMAGIGNYTSGVVMRLVRAARAMVEGRTEGLDLPVGRPDEVGEIARAMTRLAAQLAAGRAATETAMFRSAALDAGAAPVVIADASGRITYLSRAAHSLARRLDAARDGLRIGAPLADLGIGGAVDDGTTRDLRMPCGDVEMRPSAVTDGDGVRRGTVVELVDVTETRRLAATVGAIDAAMLMVEFPPDGPPHAANAMARDALARLGGADAFGAAVGATIQRAQETGAAFARVSLADGDGHPVRLIGSLAAMRGGADGDVPRVLGLFADVTPQTLAAERAESERDLLRAEQAEAVERLRDALAALSRGDLSRPLAPLGGARHEELHLDYERARGALRDALTTIRVKAGDIRETAGSITEEGRTLAQRTNAQTGELERSSAALERLARELREVSRLAARSDREVAAARDGTLRTRAVVGRAARAMDQIAASSERIASVLDVLEQIALQTDLLAINAGIAAARAGPAGQGFGVVAGEIRALARRAGGAAAEIGELLRVGSAHVASGVEAVAETTESLTEITAQVRDVAAAMSAFVETARSQSESVASLSEGLNALDRSTRMTTGLLEDGVAASERLGGDVALLLAEVDRFVTGRERGGGRQVRAA